MDRKRLAKLRRELLEMLKSPGGRKPEELVSIAKRLGRNAYNKRGKEPTYIRREDPKFVFPLSIPNHSELKTGTARSIIAQLLDDIDTWEQWLDSQEIRRQ